MKREEVARKNLNTHTQLSEIREYKGEKRMKEENTQGIETETTTKDSYNTNKKTNETELLDLRAGLPKHGTRWARAQTSHAERA